MFALLRLRNGVRSNAIRQLSSQSTSATPWFVDDRVRPQPPHFALPSGSARVTQASSLPPDLPEHIVALHDALCKSPHLEQGGVVVRPPPSTLPGPVLVEDTKPKGRRRRGGTNGGLGVPDASSGPWRWVVLAQVRHLLLYSLSLTSLVSRPACTCAQCSHFR